LPAPLNTLALRMAIDDNSVAALLEAPVRPLAGYVFAHGAGAGMQHQFMAAIAQGLAERSIATLRFQFPFMEQGSRRPDTPAVAQAAVRAAVAEAARRLPGVPLFAGGKSFGGRMTSQAQAAAPLPSVRGLVFVGFPLHPAGKPSTARATHLAKVRVPMLFLQGTRDALADLALVQAETTGLGARATLHVVDGADHAFHVLVRSGRTDAQVREELLDAMARWMLSVCPPAPAAT
jgi:predicted alpha/beta-hydrolase family hydrolase